MNHPINILRKLRDQDPAPLLWAGVAATAVFFFLVYFSIHGAFDALEQADLKTARTVESLADINRANVAVGELAMAAAAAHDTTALGVYQDAIRHRDSLLNSTADGAESTLSPACGVALRDIFATLDSVEKQAVAGGQDGDAAGALALLTDGRHAAAQSHLNGVIESAHAESKENEDLAYHVFRVHLVLSAAVLSLLLVLLVTAWMTVILALRHHRTSRHLAEGALAISEAKRRSLLQDLPQPVFIVQDGKIVFCNPAAATALGCQEASDVISRLSDSIILPPRPQRGDLDRVPDDEDEHYLTRLKRCDGETLPVEIFLRRVLFQGHDAVQILAVDITERMQAEMLLRESEERFRSMADTAPVLIWMAGLNRHTYYFNRTWLDFRGRSVAHEYGLGWTEGIHPDDQQRCREAYDGAFAVRRPFSIEFRLRHADGEYRWLLDSGVPRLTPDGSFAGYIGSCVDITDRRRAEEALRESQDTFRSFNEAAFEGIAFTDGDRILVLNDQLASMFGYRPQEMIGRSAMDFVLAEDWPLVEERSSCDDTAPYEHRAIRKDGTLMDIEVRARTVSYKGQPARLTVIRDITQRKRAEESLRESEERFRLLVESAPVSVVITREVDGTVLYANETAAALFAMSAEDLVGTCILPYYAESTDRVRLLEQLARDGWINNFSLQAQRSNGEKIWLLVSARYMTFGGERVLLAAMQDITDRKRAEAEIAAWKHRYDLIVASSGQLVYEYDIPSGLITWGGSLESVLGYSCSSTQETVNEWAAGIHPDDRDEAMRLFGDAQANASTYDCEYRYRHDHGHYLWIHDRGFFVCDSDGMPTTMLGMMRDITDLKYADKERAVRSAELERSNAELERFAYVASHDLQEPLRIMAAYADLLHKRYATQLDDDARDFIGFIVDGAERMQRLIRDLLAFSRLDTRGKSFEQVSCQEAMRQAIDNLQMAIAECSGIITHDPLPDLVADDVQMVQLFQNLLGNAVKFRADEPPRVHVSVVDQGEDWVFAVQDNGIGIDPAHFEQIFVIFRRLHSGAAYPGTGIGLAMCRKIVERHGGRIWVESEPGRGSRFLFSLRKQPTERLRS